MATYIERLNGEKLNSVGIQVCAKDRLTGKTKYYNTTWKNVENLSKARAIRQAHAFGENWEKELREKLKNTKSQHPLSYATFKDISSKFLELRKTEWAPLTYHRNADLFNGVMGLNNYFGKMRFTDIEAIDVQEYFSMLKNHEVKTVSAVIKDGCKAKIDKAIGESEMSLNKTCKQADFISKPVLYGARIGESISWKTAELICDKYGLKADEIFDKVVTTKRYSYNTLKKWHRALCALFNWAIRMHIIKTNFAGGTYMKGVIKRDKKVAKKILTNTEVEILFKHLENVPIRRALPIWAMAKTGITTAEFCGLNWSAIDFENKILRIEQDRVLLPKVGVIDGKTKNEYRYREVPIDDILIGKFKEAKAEYDYLKSGDPYFSNSNAVYYYFKQYNKKDGAPANPQFISDLLKTISISAGISVVTPHRLRAGFITKLVRSGATIDEIVRLVGHKDATMIMETYLEYNNDMARLRVAMSKGY